MTSWGRIPAVTQESAPLSWRDQPLPLPPDGRPVLPYGLGRSYGDSCLNDGGAVLLTRGLDRFMDLDEASATLTCEAGASFAEILDLILPRGFFLPVTPGTRYVTAGGAVANDVHGKNHHGEGTFGHHVRRFELRRSDGSRRLCSPTENQDLFHATIGGLGLTGLITWVEFTLKRVAGPWIEREAVRFGSLDEFVALNTADSTYTVAWLDCLSAAGRGVYFRGRHGPQSAAAAPKTPRAPLPVPFDLPGWLLNGATLRAFNSLYFALPRGSGSSSVHYVPFFYPLDGIGHWNRLYGKRGFFQYQCVVPTAAAIRGVLATIAKAGAGSFLSVLKTFGDRPSLGMISFPRPGMTLALDFPNTGPDVLKLFERLDAQVRDAGGAVYPAKDARMSAASFQAFFPRWQEFAKHVDPRFSSSFWRRVTSGA